MMIVKKTGTMGNKENEENEENEEKYSNNIKEAL